jgi:phosphoribosyl-AMP cyclohydrolase
VLKAVSTAEHGRTHERGRRVGVVARPFGLEKAYERTKPERDMSEADAAVNVQFDAQGLVPVVAQDTDTEEVLMLAYANREAISRTAETGFAHYYSRSREAVWRKGETSGHVQRVGEIRIDCDGDAILYTVSQAGGACHTGYKTCFYRTVEGVESAEDIESAGSADGIGEEIGTTEDGSTAGTGTSADIDGTDEDGSGTDSGNGIKGTDTDATALTVATRVVDDRVFDPEAVYE